MKLLHEHRIEKLPVVDDDGRLHGLFTIKDIEKARISQRRPRTSLDDSASVAQWALAATVKTVSQHS